MNNKIILIVDDTPLQAIMLRRTLAQAQYEVVTAKHGLEALEFLKKQKFSLVITDINMPQMDGFELCNAIRADPKLAEIPVIICTMLSDPADLIRGIEVGADNYITRPWNDEKLLKLVENLLKSSPHPQIALEKEEVHFGGKIYKISTSRQYILNFLLSTYEHIHQQNIELNQLKEEIQKSNRLLKDAEKEQQKILFNVFPEKVAQELLAYGSVDPARYEDVTVAFIDFEGFTESSSKLDPKILVQALEFYFENFDHIISSHELDRIKTIGDGYMYTGGIPEIGKSAYHVVSAALEIKEFIKKSAEQVKEKFGIQWVARFGIHTGPLVAGVIGKKRLAYDIWGATVNLASKLEQQGEVDQIQISSRTYEKIKDYFVCAPRGAVVIKGRKSSSDITIETFVVEKLKKEVL